MQKLNEILLIIVKVLKYLIICIHTISFLPIMITQTCSLVVSINNIFRILFKGIGYERMD